MRKLWRTSQVLKVPLFGPDLFAYNEAQLDFILEMYALDHPDEGTFVRPGEEKPLTPVQLAVQWESVLVGRARDAMMAPMMPSEATLAALRRMDRLSRPTVQAGPAKKR